MPAPQRVLLRKGYKKDVSDDINCQLVALENKDNWHNFFFIGCDWLLVTAVIYLTIWLKMNPIAYIFAILIIGSRMRALMNLLHEASHNKLFKNRILNDWMARLFTCYPMGTSFTAYQTEHFIHHGFLWDPEKDPKTIRYQTLGLIRPTSNRFLFFRRHIVKPLLLTHVAYNVLATLSLRGERRYETIVRISYFAVVFAGILLLHQSLWFLLFWVVPYLTTYQVIRYWNEMAEHAGLPEYDAWLATRNWNSSLLMRWFLAPHSDDLYHLVHHLYPLIPHYRLAVGHRLLLQVPQYASAHHCDGFFFPRRPDAPSVLQDIRRPQDLHTFRQLPSKARDKRKG